MGHVAILDRFKQIEPKILIAQDGYIYADKKIDRREVLKTIINGLPSLQKTIILPVVGPLLEDALSWGPLLTKEVDLTPTRSLLIIHYGLCILPELQEVQNQLSMGMVVFW